MVGGTRKGSRSGARRGGALLAVLWLTVALTAIAFALSRGVRVEFDRASLNVDSTRAYYLARGGVEAAMLRMALIGVGEDPENGFAPGQSFMRFTFPAGAVDVEIIGESGKLNVNTTSRPQLETLLAAMGLRQGEAAETASRIVEFRELRKRGEAGYGAAAAREEPGASLNLFPDSSFSAPRASIEELEELLLVPGVTPELLYGSWRQNREGKLVRTQGLLGALTVRGGASVNANYASRAMLLSAGISERQVEELIAIRRTRPLRAEDLAAAHGRTPAGGVSLDLGSRSSYYTLVATARLRDGRAVRSTAAMVEAGLSGPEPMRIVRWYDTVF